MIAYEEISIPAGSTGLNSTKYSGANSAFISCEVAPIRYTMDGLTIPSATVGQLLNAGDTLTLTTLEQIEKFRAFSADTSSPVVSGNLHAHYFNNRDGFRQET